MDKPTSLEILRRELLIMDEPIKALNLLRLFDAEDAKVYGTVRHIYEPEIYQKYYGMQGEDQIPDCELIEPREMIEHAELKYDRYKWIVSEFENEKPKSYLDLACYVGSLVTTAASRGIEAYGVDMTKRAVEVARDRAASKGLKCEFFCDDATTFDKVKVDMVSAFEVIEHVPDPKQFVNHLLDLSNGWVYITTPDGPYGNGKGNMGHWDWDGKELHVRGHVRVFTKESMLKLMDECGCEVGFLEVMPDQLLWCKFRREVK